MLVHGPSLGKAWGPLLCTCWAPGGRGRGQSTCHRGHAEVPQAAEGTDHSGERTSPQSPAAQAKSDHTLAIQQTTSRPRATGGWQPL